MRAFCDVPAYLERRKPIHDGTHSSGNGVGPVGISAWVNRGSSESPGAVLDEERPALSAQTEPRLATVLGVNLAGHVGLRF